MMRVMRAFIWHGASLSIGLVFMTMSLLFGSWLARLPEVQAKLGLSEGQLGVALLGTAIGAVSITPLSGWLLEKLSAGRATVWSTLIFCTVIVLPSFAVDQWTLMGALFIVGLANSFMNVAMNATASAIEAYNRSAIMSACHGMFSLGGMIGAATAGWIADMGVPLSAHLSMLALGLIGLNLAIRPILLQTPTIKKTGATFALPRGPLFRLAAIGLCIMVGESAVADWSAIYLTKELQAETWLAGWGFAGFSLTMALGRFSGDTIRMRFGKEDIVRTGALIGASGLLLAILSPVPGLAILGFCLVGLGFSTIIPILFGLAAQVPNVSAGAGIAAVASAGIAGYLVGPPLIGFLGEHFGLEAGLGFVLALALMAAALAGKKR